MCLLLDSKPLFGPAIAQSKPLSDQAPKGFAGRRRVDLTNEVRRKTKKPPPALAGKSTKKLVESVFAPKNAPNPKKTTSSP